MKLLLQRRFNSPQDSECIKGFPLVVHRNPETTSGKHLVLFVHGLTGRRYTYWGETPKFLMKDMPFSDIGLYEYATALQRWRSPSVSIPDEGELLSSEIRQIEQYEHIVIVAHSLGGIVTRGALADLVAHNRSKALRRIAGVILISSPLAGSMRVPWWLQWNADARALRPHNAYLAKTHRLLREHLQIDLVGMKRSPKGIPHWAMRASNDFWVDKFSASFLVSDSQTRLVRATHSSIKEPKDREADCYTHLRDTVTAAFRRREQRAERRETRDVVVENATTADVDAIRTLSTGFFGSEVSSRETIADLMSHQGVFRVVKEVERDATGHLVKGYFCVLPLKSDAAHQLRGGSLRGNQIAGNHLDGDNPAALYIGAVGARQRYSKALVVSEMRRHIASFLGNDPDLELITRPITADGLRLAKREGFQQRYQMADGEWLWARGHNNE